MASAGEWLRRARWAGRSKQFGKLHARIDANGKPIATMEFDLPVGDAMPLWYLWMKAVHHPAVIPVIEPGLLRYTAFDWERRGIRVSTQESARKIATRGLELVAVMERVIEELGISEARWFTNPIVKIDLEGRLRVAFAKPLARLDLIQERASIIAIGRGLDQLVSGVPRGSLIGQIIERCVDSERRDRFVTFRNVTKALRRAGGQAAPHPTSVLWDAMEQAIGFWGLRDRSTALECLDRWLSISAPPIVLELRELIAGASLEDLEIKPVRHDYLPTFSMWPQPIIEDPTSRVPVPRIFQNAYEVLIPPPRPERPIEVAAPVVTPEEHAGHLLRRRQYREALDHVDAWLTNEADEPRAHYLRGKALLALGRLPDARAAFDRACTLRPQLLEAMLLRREVDRVMVAIQASAGIANPLSSSLPDHLADLRDVLVIGRIVDAIQMLKRPAYDDDTVAQLLLADLLTRDGRAEDALVVLAPITADEAYDLRAKALHALGRTAEAEVQFSTYLRLIEQRSDRRIGSK